MADLPLDLIRGDLVEALQELEEAACYGWLVVAERKNAPPSATRCVKRAAYLVRKAERLNKQRLERERELRGKKPP